jgi:predicted molibdopterin-dependent oxidoreductase YjgC
MFKRLDNLSSRRVIIHIDGQPVECAESDTVAAVLLASGGSPYRRTIISGAPRMPLCMMGVCFDCLVEIDGIANQQGCLRSVAPGMKINRQTDIPFTPVKPMENL